MKKISRFIKLIITQEKNYPGLLIRDNLIYYLT